MPSKSDDHDPGSVGHWAKRCYLAGRAAMELVLRPYDLGATQWYVLYQLAQTGPTMQRDLLRALRVERATLSAIVTALVRKKLVEQIPDQVDQRQKLIRMTTQGAKLWRELPDLTVIPRLAFDGLNDGDIAATIAVLRTATERLENFEWKGKVT